MMLLLTLVFLAAANAEVPPQVCESMQQCLDDGDDLCWEGVHRDFSTIDALHGLCTDACVGLKEFKKIVHDAEKDHRESLKQIDNKIFDCVLDKGFKPNQMCPAYRPFPKLYDSRKDFDCWVRSFVNCSNLYQNEFLAEVEGLGTALEECAEAEDAEEFHEEQNTILDLVKRMLDYAENHPTGCVAVKDKRKRK